MKKLKAIPIIDSWQVEVMRHIYNDNLDSLATKPLPYRNYEEQQQWWTSNKHQIKGFLYEPIEIPDTFIGFLILRDRGGFQTPTIAIRKEYWGNGYGKELVFDYLEKADGPLAGSQLKSNSAICHLNSKAGWQIIGEKVEVNGPVDLLYHPGLKNSHQIEPEVFASILKYLEMPLTHTPKIQESPAS